MVSRTRVERLVTAALQPYGVTPVAVERRPSSNNQVFRVTTADGRELVVRLHRPRARSAAEIASEVRFLEAIGAAGTVTAPVPLRTRNGDATASFTIDGHTIVSTALVWIPGEVLRPGQGAGTAAVRRIGRALAGLHAIGERLPADPDSPNISADVLTRSYLRFVADDEHRAVIEAVVEMVEDLYAVDREHGVIHHDLIFSNCLHRGRSTAIIDFDDCGVAPLLQDLGGMLENIAGGPRPGALRAAFLDGYSSVRLVPARDELELDAMIAVRHAWTTAWTHMRGAQGDFTPERVEAISDYRMTEARRILRRL